MANIRIDIDSVILDNQTITFKSPADCSDITGLIVYYVDNGLSKSQVFQFADAHGNNVGDIDLFASDVIVKVVLDVEASKAYVQNADTNAYLENRLKGKSSTGHKHTKSEITDFPTSMTPTAHNHAASDITGGTLAVGIGGTGVTKNPSMLTNLGSTSADSVFAASPRPGVTGTLPVANGGTGNTTAKGAEFAINGGIEESTAAMADDFRMVFAHTNPTKDVGVFLYRKVSTVWNYFKAKADSLYAAKSHGSHVPTPETANNAKFLRNDNSWQTVTPANIGAAESSHTHTKSQISDFPTTMTPSAHNQAASTITAGTFAATGVKAAAGTDYTTERVRNIVMTTTDPGAGTASSYANGTVVLVYE